MVQKTKRTLLKGTAAAVGAATFAPYLLANQAPVRIGYAMARKLFGYFSRKGIRDVHTSVLWDAVDMLSFFKSLGFDRSTFINLIKHVG